MHFTDWKARVFKSWEVGSENVCPVSDRPTIKSEFPGERPVGLFVFNTSPRQFFLGNFGEQQLWIDILTHNSDLKFETQVPNAQQYVSE